MNGYLPFSEAEVDILCRPTVERQIWHYGVEIDGLRYNSPGLQLLRQRIGVKKNGCSSHMVSLYRNHDDLGEILAYDNFSKEFIVADATNAAYARGLSFHAHNIIRKQQKRRGRGSESDDKLARAKQRIRQEVESLTISTSLRKRKKAAKIKRARINVAKPSDKPTSLASHQPLPSHPTQAFEIYETVTIRRMPNGE